VSLPQQTGYGRRLALRWVHLLLGGALLMPYFLLVAVGITVVRPGTDPLRGLTWPLTAYLLCLPLVALTALLFPLVRVLESAAGVLCASCPRVPWSRLRSRVAPGRRGGVRLAGSPCTSAPEHW
jgi:hypothetical protein